MHLRGQASIGKTRRVEAAVHMAMEEIASELALVDESLRTLHATDVARPAETYTWAFEHALVRDVAFHSLLHRKRRELHRLVAETFKQLQSDTADTLPELLAHHWSKARRAAKIGAVMAVDSRVGVLAIGQSPSGGTLSTGVAGTRFSWVGS